MKESFTEITTDHLEINRASITLIGYKYKSLQTKVL